MWNNGPLASTRTWWRSSLQCLPLFLQGIPTTLSSSNLSPTSYWLPATTPTHKPHSNTYRIRLVASAATSTSSYHTARATVWARYPKISPFSTLSNELGTLALPITVTLKNLKLLTKTSSRLATVVPTRLTIFCRCYNWKHTYFISSRKSGFYCIWLN